MAEGAARLRPARRGDEAAPVGGKQTLAPPHAVILIEQPEPREIARAGPDLARQDIIAVLVMLGKGPRHAEPVEEGGGVERSEEHTSELQSLMRISYAVFCLKKKKKKHNKTEHR